LGDVDVMEVVEKALGLGKAMNEQKGEFKRALGEVVSTRDKLPEMYNAANSLMAMFGEVDMGEFTESLGAMVKLYPEVSEKARSVIYPTGPLACILTPSPYAQTVEDRVARCKNFVDVSAITDMVKKTEAEVKALVAKGLGDDAEAPGGSSMNREVDYFVEKSETVSEVLERVADGDVDGMARELGELLMDTMKEKMQGNAQAAAQAAAGKAGKAAMESLSGAISGWFD